MQYLGTVFEQLSTNDREVRRAWRRRADRQLARIRRTRRAE
jgi:hypothetical protein